MSLRVEKSVRESCESLKVLVLGAGQVGSALASLIKKKHDVTVLDLEAQTAPKQHFDVMHVCYPYSLHFEGYTFGYTQICNRVTLFLSERSFNKHSFFL